jgi:hypothetical protein
MVVRGRIENGVVVLDHGVRLPEGQEVTVLVGGEEKLAQTSQAARHSILDIAPVSLGSLLLPLANDDDLLGEMLEGRS